MSYRKLTIYTFGFLALPSVAFANAGTPLMWLTGLHLLIGNAVIGSFEGGLLINRFSAPKTRSVGLLILANYFSSWVGGWFITNIIADKLPLDINNAWFFFWVIVFITYLMTLGLEFPFIYAAFLGGPDRLRKSLTGTALTQTTSYVILFGLYWMVSGTTLFTKTDVVQLSEIPLPQQVSMYFISAQDDDVYRRKLSSSNIEKVFDLHSSNRNDRLFIRKSTAKTNRWNLVARLETGDYQNPRYVTLRDAKQMETAPSWRSRLKEPGEEPGTWFNIGSVSKLGDAEKSDWEFRAGFWSAEGLHGTDGKTGARTGFSYDTPFVSWIVRNATHLPGDKVLLQLGYDQICIYDPVMSRIALIAKGRGPVAVIEIE